MLGVVLGMAVVVGVVVPLPIPRNIKKNTAYHNHTSILLQMLSFDWLHYSQSIVYSSIHSDRILRRDFFLKDWLKIGFFVVEYAMFYV